MRRLCPFTMACALLAGGLACGGDETTGVGETLDDVEATDLAQGSDIGLAPEATDGAATDILQEGVSLGADSVGETGTTDTVPPPPDIVDPDAPCVAQCEGKDCGDDGCGFICGYCVENYMCQEHLCVPVCSPDCEDKACGPNGCGGTCGECLDELECGEDGLCYEPECVPDCTGGKICGPNGCGGECGICAAPKICQSGGCALGPCGTITDEGECQGGVAVWCEGGSTLVEDPCEQGEACAYDPFAGKYSCVEVGECIPDCLDKNCGADGCGGTCPWACADGWSCEGADCVPQPGGDCGGITTIGLCLEQVLWFCATEKLYSVDCTEIGEGCKWNSALGKFACSP